MIRRLAPAPDSYDLDQLRALVPAALDVNEVDVDGSVHLAVYLDDDTTMDDADWAGVIAGYETEPPPAAAPDPDTALEQALTDAATVDDVKAALLAWIAARRPV